MKKHGLLLLFLAVSAVMALGCSNAGPRKFLFFGEYTPEKVEAFEDYWSDFPFKPNDPNLPLRRGKGGVIRFFKKNNYTRSIMVDGDLTVNVYYSVEEGVSLRQPDARMVLTSKELNESHRKFDKETGYSYHVYLDLGEYDQPEEEITILSVFKDAQTGQVTLSKEIRTTAMGTTPLRKGKDSKIADAAKRWANKRLGEDVEDPIAELQAKYSARNKERREAEEAAGDTRLSKTIDLNSTQFENINDISSVRSASYLEQAQARHDEALERAIEENQKKSEYYRDLKRRRLEDYYEERNSKLDDVSSLRDSGKISRDLNFSDPYKEGSEFQRSMTEHFSSTAERIGSEAIKEQDKSLQKNKTENKSDPSRLPSKSQTPKSSSVPEGFSPVHGQQIVDMDNLRPSEMDLLNDFQPDSDAPKTEVYTKKDY